MADDATSNNNDDKWSCYSCRHVCGLGEEMFAQQLCVSSLFTVLASIMVNC